jgi:hypothetical protein
MTGFFNKLSVQALSPDGEVAVTGGGDGVIPFCDILS